MTFQIPLPLKAEHAELHEELLKATQAGGRVGAAAQRVAKLLNPHFMKEEEFALPPLGLLQPLARGKWAPEIADVLKLTDRLEAEMPAMLAEHKEIVAALSELGALAEAEKKPDIAAFARKLKLHAETEERVLYPAAVLIGRFVRAKLSELEPE
jgi:hypothetical protein